MHALDQRDEAWRRPLQHGPPTGGGLFRWLEGEERTGRPGPAARKVPGEAYPFLDGRLLPQGQGLRATVSVMAVGFVLISAAPGKEHDVYNTLLKVSEIVELHPLFGEYDLIAKLEAADFDTLGHVIVNKIRSIEGVVDTKTLTGTKF